ncbi:glycosyltransferase family 2 protein [Granulosicoccus antarcticus]|uniref:Poly-beta-1,6-N-acetyl-D-glucosamine synthase n=1 Tax=Granulosicoccus antarcticus IMCC3135 TaxID=1192854 RepID=A0A2Z2NYG4_9GAMM|nr:glycosyltransferase family 2 protein [Granulosicoccus antarcticus]ASJ74971.1 Poly-beta-1,6-N-acetyl-D-glucosamine synthase [Granulosicoccus antarcticus IMCC3135]
MTYIFLAATLFCLYTYLGFPLVLHLRANRARVVLGQANNPLPPSEDQLPSVSIIIAAHNEAGNLPGKIASLEALDYPEHLLECIFVSDGSTDDTVDIFSDACESHERWQLYHYGAAAGKPTALNIGVSRARGDIVVFMDARQSVAPAAIRALVNRLQEQSIGVVSGELVLHDDLGREAANVGLYWKYEKWIRDNESHLFSTTGATGALYAIRRADYQPLPADALLDDFDTPISLLKLGKRTVLEPAAQIFDQAEADSSREFKRKVRTLTGNFQSFSRHSWLFDPRINPIWWQFLSHKVFRLLVPYALMLALFASVAGNTPFLSAMLLVQICFYSLGLLGVLGLDTRLTSIIKIFLQLNVAAVIGAWRASQGGGSAVRWKTS